MPDNLLQLRQTHGLTIQQVAEGSDVLASILAQAEAGRVKLFPSERMVLQRFYRGQAMPKLAPHHKAKPAADPISKSRRTVTVLPDIGFGPYDINASSDERAVDRVIAEIIEPAKKTGALKESVTVVCGKLGKGV